MTRKPSTKLSARDQSGHLKSLRRTSSVAGLMPPAMMWTSWCIRLLQILSSSSQSAASLKNLCA